MAKKYKLLKKDFIEFYGRKLYRIQALRDSGIVRKGDLGGHIEKEANLSHEGNCWIGGNAKVFHNARVYGDAWIYGHAEVFGAAWIFDNAGVSGHVKVFGYARVSGNALITDNAIVFGIAVVFGDAEVSKIPIVLSGLKYVITVTDNHMSIGCVIKKKEEWLNLDEAWIRENYPKDLGFWRGNKKKILNLIEET